MRPLAALLALSATLAAAAPAAAQVAPAPAPAPAPPAAAAPYPYGYPYGPPPYSAYPAPYGGWVPLPPPRVTERRSEGMRVGGIILFAFGGVATVVGVGVTLAASLNACVFVEADSGGATPQSVAHGERVGTARQALSTCDGGPSLGLGILAGGVLGSLLGVPLFVIGNAQVRVRPHAFAALPEIRPTASGADLRWTF